MRSPNPEEFKVAAAIAILRRLKGNLKEIPENIDNNSSSFEVIIAQANNWLNTFRTKIGEVKGKLDRAHRTAPKHDDSIKNVLKYISDDMDGRNGYKLGTHFAKKLINDILDGTSTFEFNDKEIALCIDRSFGTKIASVGYIIRNDTDTFIHPLHNLADHLFWYLNTLEFYIRSYFSALEFDNQIIDAKIEEYEKSGQY